MAFFTGISKNAPVFFGGACLSQILQAGAAYAVGDSQDRLSRSRSALIPGSASARWSSIRCASESPLPGATSTGARGTCCARVHHPERDLPLRRLRRLARPQSLQSPARRPALRRPGCPAPARLWPACLIHGRCMKRRMRGPYGMRADQKSPFRIVSGRRRRPISRSGVPVARFGLIDAWH
jgi:hypothetical protein